MTKIKKMSRKNLDIAIKEAKKSDIACINYRCEFRGDGCWGCNSHESKKHGSSNSGRQESNNKWAYWED